MPDLQPGETVQQVIRTTMPAVLRSVGVATGLAGALFLLIAGADEGFDLPRFLISVGLFGAVMLGMALLLDRNREWVLTDRRIIGPRGTSLDLTPDLRIRRLIYALKLSQRGRPSMTIRSVPDLGQLGRAIHDLAQRAPKP